MNLVVARGVSGSPLPLPPGPAVPAFLPEYTQWLSRRDTGRFFLLILWHFCTPGIFWNWAGSTSLENYRWAKLSIEYTYSIYFKIGTGPVIANYVHIGQSVPYVTVHISPAVYHHLPFTPHLLCPILSLQPYPYPPSPRMLLSMQIRLAFSWSDFYG